MNDLVNYLLGPLDKTACVYFLIISGLFLMSFAILFSLEVIYLLRNSGKINLRIITTGVIMLFNTFLTYFVNRLLYSMCSKSLA